MTAHYEIQIEGQLDQRWSETFTGLEVEVRQSSDGLTLTTLHCPSLDQAKLRGMLNMAWDLNLEVVQVRRLPAPSDEERPANGGSAGLASADLSVHGG